MGRQHPPLPSFWVGVGKIFYKFIFTLFLDCPFFFLSVDCPSSLFFSRCCGWFFFRLGGGVSVWGFFVSCIFWKKAKLHVYKLCVLAIILENFSFLFLVGVGAHLTFHMFGKRLWEEPIRKVLFFKKRKNWVPTLK